MWSPRSVRLRSADGVTSPIQWQRSSGPSWTTRPAVTSAVLACATYGTGARAIHPGRCRLLGEVCLEVNMAALTGERRKATGRLGANYAVRLILAHITAAAAVTLVILSLSRNTVGDARNLLSERNLIALVGLVTVSSIAGAVAGVLNVLPSVRWYAAGAEPTPAQQRAAMRIATRQSTVQFAVWVGSGAVFVLLNLHAGGGVAYVIGTAMFFGAATAASMHYLITTQGLRR